MTFKNTLTRNTQAKYSFCKDTKTRYRVQISSKRQETLNKHFKTSYWTLWVETERRFMVSTSKNISCIQPQKEVLFITNY